MTWLATSCLLALAVLFGGSVLPKLRHPHLFASALAGYGLPRRAAVILSPIGILTEAVAALLLAIGQWPRMAAAVALGLLVLYSLFVIFALASGRAGISCGCLAFGSDRAVSWTLVLRNVVAMLLALVPLWTGSGPDHWGVWLQALPPALVFALLLALVDDLGWLYDFIHS